MMDVFVCVHMEFLDNCAMLQKFSREIIIWNLENLIP